MVVVFRSYFVRFWIKCPCVQGVFLFYKAFIIRVLLDFSQAGGAASEAHSGTQPKATGIPNGSSVCWFATLHRLFGSLWLGTGATVAAITAYPDGPDARGKKRRHTACFSYGF